MKGVVSVFHRCPMTGPVRRVILTADTASPSHPTHAAPGRLPVLMPTKKPDPILRALEELESILDEMEEDLDALRSHLTKQAPAKTSSKPPAAK